jgi:hypothetical protein
MKLKSFCTTKEMISKLKGPPTDWEKIFASYAPKGAQKLPPPKKSMNQ